MKNNRQYLAVGLFVVIATTILITVWLWFSASKHRAYNTYLSIFNEPVDGLSTNSIIKYNGVEVGKVKKIELDPTNPRNIFVYLNILIKTPINVDTFAIMKSQGVTGLSYIDLRLPPNSVGNKILKPHNQEPYPKIATQTSFFYSLTEQAQSLTHNFQDISGQVKVLLDKDNLTHIRNILSNIDKTTNAFARHSDQIEKSISSINQVLNNMKQNTSNLDVALQNISILTQALTQTDQHANDLLENMQHTTLQNINTQILPELNRTLKNINKSSSQLDSLLTTINRNPSALIRGNAPLNPGPGE